jgi:hypothetical protein
LVKRSGDNFEVYSFLRAVFSSIQTEPLVPSEIYISTVALYKIYGYVL